MAYLGIDEVAKRLGLQDTSVYELLESKQPPGIKLGGHWLIPEAEMESLLHDELIRQNPALNKQTDLDRTLDSGSESSVNPKYRFTLRGKPFGARSLVEVLVIVLRELAAIEPIFLDRLAAVRLRKKRYVARTPNDLFLGRPDLVERFSRPLGNGWWVGVNFNAAEIEQALKTACAVAGLRYGIDLMIHKEAGPKDIKKAMTLIGLGKDLRAQKSEDLDELYAQAIEDRIHGSRGG